MDWTKAEWYLRAVFCSRWGASSPPPPQLRPIGRRVILIPVRSFDCERAGDGRPRGHWWLIFWALTDCVSNGALIAFPPPPTHHCKQAPPPPKKRKKNPYKFPHVGKAGQEWPFLSNVQPAVCDRPDVQFKINILATTTSSKYQPGRGVRLAERRHGSEVLWPRILHSTSAGIRFLAAPLSIFIRRCRTSAHEVY